MKKILILENDWTLLSSLSDFLKKKGHLSYCSQSIKRAEELLKKKTFDLFLCERVLPDGDTLDLLEKMKERKLFTRILVFSSKKSLVDRIATLKLADDFIAKPFNFTELTLKIKNILCLEKIGDQDFFENSFLSLKEDSFFTDKVNHFRPQELKILECFSKHRNFVISYETISSYVWGYKETIPLKKTISVYIRRIRIKLPDNFKIETIKNRGYRFINLKEK